MSNHPYSLRSRVSNSSLTTRTPIQSPAPKPVKSPRKGPFSVSTLQLKHVVGTTTSTPSGLSCCPATSSYAYCAGSVAVLAIADTNNSVSYRYYKARPTAVPVNQSAPTYDSPLNSSTPTRRRIGLIGRRPAEDGGGSIFGSSWLDDAGSQTWSARERIKTASCVSLSPDGRLLAVGETGYNPRVLLFSTSASASTDLPLSIISLHTVGVRCIAFSPNSNYLATLGDVNDGFLYIWQVNTKTGVLKLHSSNKCTTTVYDMTWCGNSVVTVGTRHIKIWQAPAGGNAQSSRKSRAKQEGEIPSPGPAPIQGRNCLLGTFVHATFTSVVAISDVKAVVCADDGNICQLDLSQIRPELWPLIKTGDSIAALSSKQDPCRLIWTNGEGLLEEQVLTAKPEADVSQSTTRNSTEIQGRGRITRRPLLRQSLGFEPSKVAKIVALGCLDQITVCIDNEGTVRTTRTETQDFGPDICNSASHSGPVRGVQHLPQEAGLGMFFTWDVLGKICFWNQEGECLQAKFVGLDNDTSSEDDVANELRIVRYSPAAKAFLTGDQLGVLKVLDQSSWNCLHAVRAHSAEISNVDVSSTRKIIATCSRDRMVQVFRLPDQQFELLQTCDDHISAVNQVLFNRNGQRLISCSADRTIVVRELVESKLSDNVVCAFIATRTITLKAAPLSMGVMPSQPDNLVVSTQDRQVSQVSLNTGGVLSSFKVSDRETDDTVSLNAICLGESSINEKSCLVAGYSMTDKSVRLYDLQKGLLLGRDSGHTEGVTDVCIFRTEPLEGEPSQTTIVSTGLDGTIMLWSVAEAGQPALTPQQELSLSQTFETDPEKILITASPSSLPPMRKILSKMDIADFVRQSSPTREVSPHTLRRKTSRLALTTSVEEVPEAPVSSGLKLHPQERKSDKATRSPSPPTQPVLRLQRQRSRPDVSKAMPTSVPSTPRHSTRANNGRLRRPPSVPSDLRAQARQQSVSVANDLGSIGTMTEQVCCMLKAYQKKLIVSHGGLELDELEADLESALLAVRQKSTKADNSTRAVTMRENIEGQIHDLSVLLEKVNVG